MNPRTELSENDANNVDVFSEHEHKDLAAMIENNHEPEDCQSTNLSDHTSHDSQKCWKEKGKFSTILLQSIIKDVHKLECIPQVMNVKNVSYKKNYEVIVPSSGSSKGIIIIIIS